MEGDGLRVVPGSVLLLEAGVARGVMTVGAVVGRGVGGPVGLAVGAGVGGRVGAGVDAGVMTKGPGGRRGPLIRWEFTALLWYALAVQARSGLAVAMTRTMKIALAPLASRQKSFVVPNVT